MDQYYYYERIELLMLIETGKKSDTQILMFSVISVSSLIDAKRGPFLSEGRHRRLGECLTLPPSGSAPFVIPSRFCSNTRAEDEATAALNSHHTTPASAVHWKKLSFTICNCLFTSFPPSTSSLFGKTSQFFTVV